jgi:hypothetical protein
MTLLLFRVTLSVTLRRYAELVMARAGAAAGRE